MKNITRHKGKITNLKRLPSSRHGNPRWIMKIDGWTCRTLPDSMHAYALSSSSEGREVTAEIGTYYGSPAIHSLKFEPKGDK
jgi:hypothetical protein|tara:strand:+ start:2146 stop:2391 length:246 start_codon:yes stop_codon:yes gene_type:complete